MKDEEEADEYLEKFGEIHSNLNEYTNMRNDIITDLEKFVGIDDKEIMESVDESKYLNAKQKKLPDGLKKNIIAKMKKSGKTLDSKKEDDKEKNCKDDDECKKDDNKEKKTGSDEKKYLSPKQRKLPEGLKKGIIAKNKKKEVNESIDDEPGKITFIDDRKVTNKVYDKLVQYKKEGRINFHNFGSEYQISYIIDDKEVTDFLNRVKNSKFNVAVNESKKQTKSKKEDFIPTKKLKNLKSFYEICYDGDGTEKSDINDDSWIKGTREELLRPMFKNLPDTTIRPSYDILRAGKIVSLFGTEGRVIGIKNGMLELSVMDDKTNKHKTVKYDMNEVMKELKKSNKIENKKVNESVEYITVLMDKFGLDLEQAAELDKIVDEINEMVDLDDRMDYVEGLVLWDVTEDEDKEEEIMEYLKDMCIN
jgi:hypothetical protein